MSSAQPAFLHGPGQLPRDGTALHIVSALDPLPSISNHDVHNSPRANLIEAAPQLKLPLPRSVKLTTKSAFTAMFVPSSFFICSHLLTTLKGFYFIFYFQEKILLCSLGCPRTLCRPGWLQTHRNLPDSISQCWDKGCVTPLLA